MDLIERAHYAAWLAERGLDDVAKHRPGQHDQLAHGRRGGQPGRGEKRRDALARITADYERARAKVSPERRAKGEARIAGMNERADARKKKTASELSSGESVGYAHHMQTNVPATTAFDGPLKDLPKNLAMVRCDRHGQPTITAGKVKAEALVCGACGADGYQTTRNIKASVRVLVMTPEAEANGRAIIRAAAKHEKAMLAAAGYRPLGDFKVGDTVKYRGSRGKTIDGVRSDGYFTFEGDLGGLGTPKHLATANLEAPTEHEVRQQAVAQAFKDHPYR